MDQFVYLMQRRALKIRRLKAKRVINKAKNKGCVDCGVKDKRVLEFDHIKGVKEFNISHGYVKGYSVGRITKEINKCVVVCRNCHIIRSKKSWKIKYKGI